MYSKYSIHFVSNSSVHICSIFAVQCIYLYPTLFFKLNNALRFWRFLQLVMLKPFFLLWQKSKWQRISIWKYEFFLPFANEKILRTCNLQTSWSIRFDSSCPFLNDKYTKSLFNATFSSGKKMCLLKPYLFTQPNPTYGIISWTISWQTITIFLSCMVWFAN